MVPARLCWKKSTCPFTVLKTGRDPDRVAGNGERLVAGRRGRRVFDLSAQVLHPVLQVLLVRTHHLEPLEHRPCGRRETAAAVTNVRSLQVRFSTFSGRPTVELERVFVSVTVVQFGHRHAGQRQFPLQRGITGKQNVKFFSCRAAHFEFQGSKWKKINTIL